MNSSHILNTINGEEAYILGINVDMHEDTETEFKCWTLTKNFSWVIDLLQEYICAFSNTTGGILYIGIADNGRVVGTFCDRALMDRTALAIDGIRMKVKPILSQPSQVRVWFKKVVQFNGGRYLLVPNTYVIELHVREGNKGEIYTTHDGKVFIRLSASNRELVGSALVKYVKEKSR